MSHPLIQLAKTAMSRHLEGRPLKSQEALALCRRWMAEGAASGKVEPFEPAACFVSLKKEGALRGCIGTLEPALPTLAEEVAANAVAAAVRDPRFAPVREEELERLSVSVDVLSRPEPVEGPEALDPSRYGLIVSWQGRRGVLLPDLEGVDSVERQIQICREKGGIPQDAPLRLERFTVIRLKR